MVMFDFRGSVLPRMQCSAQPEYWCTALLNPMISGKIKELKKNTFKKNAKFFVIQKVLNIKFNPCYLNRTYILYCSLDNCINFLFLLAKSNVLRWNFEKILFDKMGHPVRRYVPHTEVFILFSNYFLFVWHFLTSLV